MTEKKDTGSAITFTVGLIALALIAGGAAWTYPPAGLFIPGILLWARIK